jgi:hypothetical protein
MRNFLYIISILFFLSGCANKSLVKLDEVPLQKAKSSSIYVARFEGDPRFVDESTDCFIVKLRELLQAKIIQGEPSRTEGEDIKSGSNISSPDKLIEIAKKNGSEILILGKVLGHKEILGSFFPISDGLIIIRIFDVKTKQQIGLIHRSALLITFSEGRTITNASENAAKDLAKVISGE